MRLKWGSLIIGMLIAISGIGGQEIVNDFGKGKGYIRPTKEVRDAAYRASFAKHGNKIKSMAAVAKVSAPAEFDCRDAKWVQDWAGNQASCGSCYLYATGKQIRDALVKSGQFKNDQIETAIQYFMDRPRDFGGCGGGWGWEVASWTLKNGMPAEWYIDSAGKKINDYPAYEARSGNDRTAPGAKMFHLEDIGWVNGDQNGDAAPTLDEFKACMLAYGSINFALDAGGQFGGYSDGIITSMGSNIDHEIRAIGWSDSKKAVLVYNQWQGWGIGGKGVGWISYQAFFSRCVEMFWVKAAGGGPGPPPDPIPGQFTITPASATIAPKGAQQFTTNPPAAFWLAVDGGAITQSGLYTAPEALGTYSVLAVSAKPVAIAMATVTVSNTPPPPQGPTIVIGPDVKPGTYIMLKPGEEIAPLGTKAELERIRAAVNSLLPPAQKLPTTIEPPLIEKKDPVKQELKKTMPKAEIKSSTYNAMCREAVEKNMALVVGLGLDVPKGNWISYRVEIPWIVYDDVKEWTWYTKGYIVSRPRDGVMAQIKTMHSEAVLDDFYRALAPWFAERQIDVKYNPDRQPERDPKTGAKKKGG